MLNRVVMVGAIALAIGATAAAQDVKMCIAPAADGYDTYLAAAMAIKRVPATVVADCADAHFRIDAMSESQRPGWAATVFTRQIRTNEAASVRIVRLDNGVVVWAYNYTMTNANRGKQSSAESVAKHLKKAMTAWLKTQGVQ